MASDAPVLFSVIDPFQSSNAKMRAGRGHARVAAQPRTHSIGVSRATTSPLFWRLWVRFDTKMLRKENEAAPFVDFEMRLVDMEERTFVLCEWTPEYEHLRPRLHAYKCLIELPGLEFRVPKMRETVEQYEKRLSDARFELLQLEKQVADYKIAIAEAGVFHVM